MAEIRVHANDSHTAQTISDPGAQGAFLARYAIGYEQWPIERLDGDAASAADDSQTFILETFRDEVTRVMSDKGYASADVIRLTPETPNLDGLLAKFDKEHLHDEDEVRFVVGGRGVFTIHNDDDNIVFDVEVEPGDLLIVPEGTWHWFTLCEDRTITCIRLFKSQAGWTPHYRA